MKKIFNLLSTAIIAFGISACSDVPAPYDINDSGTGDGDNSTYINESFTSSFGSFTVKTVKGIDWVIDFSTAKASGYNNSDKTNTESDSYLVSKTIDLSASTGAYIEFDYILRYASSGTNKLLITDNYTNDPTTTTWTDITGKLTEGSDWTTFESYAKNIPAEFIGKKAVNIAFHYTASSSNSATWEVKNMKVKEGTVAESEEPVIDGGTRNNPFDVTTAKSAAQGQTGWVKGYIVGWVDGQSYSDGARFSIPTEAQTEILIAPTADETNADNCMPVQLPVGDIRTALELSKNTGLYKKEVLLYGSLEKYFGQGGMKSTSAAVIDGNLVGKDPDNTTPDVPAGEQKGDGTKESPYNVAKAQAIIAAGSYKEGEKVYVSGIISEIKSIDTGQFGNAEYRISDDGTTSNQLIVYRGYGLGGKKFTSADEIKVGDKVVVLGELTNFMGNTPEIATGSTIYSLNGNTEGGSTEEPGGGDEPSGDKATISKSGTTITMTNPNATASETAITCDFSTQGWENASDPTKVTLEDGTTIEFAQEGGNNAPKFYSATKGVRMYALNSMTVTGSKAIASIVATCDSYGGTDYIGNDMLYTAISGNTWKMVNDHTGNSGGVQVRVKTLTITYAK